MKQVGLIFFARPWQMQDEVTRMMKGGLSVEYLVCESLRPVEASEDGSRGVRHCKESLPIEKLANLPKIPGYYELEFEMKPNNKGKAELKLVDAKLVPEPKAS